jgi:PEP-CTERM motif
MKSACSLALVFVFALPFTGRADLIYDVSRTVGAGTATGFIETDGVIGVLAVSDIVDWNLKLINGSSNLDLTGPLSGNDSLVSNSVLDADLAATSTDLLFNFSAANAGYLLFQDTNPGFGSGAKYYCDAASNQDFVCATGEDLVPVSVFDPSYQTNGTITGNVIIGSIRSVPPVPEPTSVLLMSTALFGVGFVARKRIARGLSAAIRTNS